MPSSSTIYAWTLWRGWPLSGAIGREISPRMVGNLPVNAPIFVKVSVVSSAYEATKTLVLTWLLLNLWPGEYFRLSAACSAWPTTAALRLHLRRALSCARGAGTGRSRQGLQTTPSGRSATEESR